MRVGGGEVFVFVGGFFVVGKVLYSFLIFSSSFTVSCNLMSLWY